MNGVKTLSPERIAEIKAFKNTNFADCPIMNEDELKQLRPRHPENFKQEKIFTTNRLPTVNHEPNEPII